MTVSSTPVLVQAPKVGGYSILPADTTTFKTVITGGTNGSKVTGLLARSTDTAARVLNLRVNRSSTYFYLPSVNIPITAGFDGATASVDLMGSTNGPGYPIDNDGNHYLFLQASDILEVASQVTVTTAKEIDVTAIYGDF